jgi:hypothetical protein
MIVITRSTYPTSVAVEISKRFVKAGKNPFPSFMKRLYVLSDSVGGGDIEVISLYEIEDGRIPDAYREFLKYFSQYFDLNGYKYEIKPMLTAQEAIPIIQPK